MTETNLFSPLGFAVVVLVGALVAGVLESRVKDASTAFLAGLVAGVLVAATTPAPAILYEVIRAVRGLFG